MNLVTIIIVNWNGRAFIDKCLEGLRRQTFKHTTTIMVDNASTDGSLELVSSRYPEVKTIPLPENLGFAAANNIVINSVETEYVVLLNPDAVPDPKWLEKIVGAIKCHPEAGMIASKMLFGENPDVIDRAGDVYTTAGTALLRGRGESPENYCQPKWVFGACAGAALYRVCMLNEIGLFDEDFFLLYEDVDLSFRAQLRGYKCLYVPDAVVYHQASSSIGDDTSTAVYYSHRNLDWVYIQNMPARHFKRTIIPHLFYVLASFIFFAAKGRGLDYLRAKRDALKGLRRALHKRLRVQNTKQVPDEYIWSLLEKERYLPRLIRRLG